MLPGAYVLPLQVSSLVGATKEESEACDHAEKVVGRKATHCDEPLN